MLELADVAEEMMRARIIREHPEFAPNDLEREIGRWLLCRDAPSDPDWIEVPWRG